MITIRQIERLWKDKKFKRLMRDCTAARPEASLRLETDLANRLAAAAMAVVRLDELNRQTAPVFDLLLAAVLSGQEADGGWGDAPTTALCLRALAIAGGPVEAIGRGIEFVHNLQREEGLWPAGPLKWVPGDPYLTAFALLHLTADARLRGFVDRLNLDAAADWLDFNPGRLDAETGRLWGRVGSRCRVRQVAT